MTRETPGASTNHENDPIGSQHGNAGSRLRSVHIDLEARVIETLAHDGLVTRFTFRSDGVFQQLITNGALDAVTRRLLLADQPADSPVDSDLTEHGPADPGVAPSSHLAPGRLLDEQTSTPHGAVVEAAGEVLAPSSPAVPASSLQDTVRSREKQPALVLPGRLQTRPLEGRPDSRGKPTAWARFLAHVEGADNALLLSATFHHRTREVALQLADGDPITAQGYLHPSRDPERLSTFSVFHLINYPGKPLKNPG